MKFTSGHYSFSRKNPQIKLFQIFKGETESSFSSTYRVSSALNSKYWSESCSAKSKTLCNPRLHYSPPGSSVHGILQARILEWVAIPFSRGSSQSSDQTQVSPNAGRFFTVWAPREALAQNNPRTKTARLEQTRAEPQHCFLMRAGPGHCGRLQQAAVLRWSQAPV